MRKYGLKDVTEDTILAEFDTVDEANEAIYEHELNGEHDLAVVEL